MVSFASALVLWWKIWGIASALQILHYRSKSKNFIGTNTRRWNTDALARNHTSPTRSQNPVGQINFLQSRCTLADDQNFSNSGAYDSGSVACPSSLSLSPRQINWSLSDTSPGIYKLWKLSELLQKSEGSVRNPTSVRLANASIPRQHRGADCRCIFAECGGQYLSRFEAGLKRAPLRFLDYRVQNQITRLHHPAT